MLLDLYFNVVQQTISCFFLMKFLCDIAIAYIYKNQSIWRKVSHDVVVNQ